MKAAKFVAIALVVALAASALLPLGANAVGNANLRVYIQGPDVAGTSKNTLFKVVIIGAEAGGWKYEYYLRGVSKSDNITGANPTSANANKGNVSETSITINATMPSVKSNVEIYFNLTKSQDSGMLWQVVTKRITVVTPINVTCQVKNPTSLEVSKVNYQVYIDGSLIENNTIASIAPNAYTNLTVQWYVDKPKYGAHNVQFKFDLNGDGNFTTSNTDLLIEETIYTKATGVDWMLVLVVLAALLVTIIGFILLKRRLDKAK